MHTPRLTLLAALCALLAACTPQAPTPATPGPNPPGATPGIVGGHVNANGDPVVQLSDGREFTELNLERLRADWQRYGTENAAQTLAVRRQDAPLPSRVDWSADSRFGVSQGSRGTCIVFSNVAALEAAYKRDYGLTLDLSEQFLNTMRRTLDLPLPGEADALPRAEGLPASWGGGGSNDTQINYMLYRGGVPPEADAPYVDLLGHYTNDQGQPYDHEDYEDTTQAGDQPMTPADWRNYRDGSVSQRSIDDFNLSSRHAGSYRIPAPQSLTHLPVAALEHALYRATGVAYAPPAVLSDPTWFKQQLAAHRDVVFDFSGGWNSPDRHDHIWYPDPHPTWGHSMLMIGYDDTRRAFLVRNSWGEDAPVLFSYDFVTQGYVGQAHVFTGVADPRTPAPRYPLYLGLWDLKAGTLSGRLDVSHLPGTLTRAQLGGVADRRLGTFFPSTGNPLRVNGSFSDVGLSFNMDLAQPDLPYDDVTRGLSFTGAALDASHLVLRGTLHPASGPDVPFVAVKENEAPTVRLSTLGAPLVGRDINVTALITDELEPHCCTVAWDPAPSALTSLGATFRFTTPGPRTVTVTVTDPLGLSQRATLTLNPVNAPPTAVISTPADGATAYVGDPVQLNGSGLDPNEGPGPGSGQLDSGCTWTSSVSTDTVPGGCTPSVTFTSTGPRTVSLRIQDPQGAFSDPVSVTLSVLARPANLPPTANIAIAPVKTAYVYTGTADGSDTLSLSANASDPENDLPLNYAWQAVKLAADGSPIGTPLALGSTDGVTWALAGRTVYDFLIGNGGGTCQSSGQRVRLEVRVTDRLGNLRPPFTDARTIVVSCPPS